MDSVGKHGMEQAVRRLADPLVSDLGLEIVDAVLARRGSRWHVRLDIDRPGPVGVGLDDCARVSGALEAALDESEVADESYVLEISSPGLDRPIRTDDDLRRNTGREIDVETGEPVSGRRSFSGVLLGASVHEVRIQEREGREVSIPRSLIVRARQQIEFK